MLHNVHLLNAEQFYKKNSIDFLFFDTSTHVAKTQIVYIDSVFVFGSS